MPTSVKMPRLGESVAEGTVGAWLKNEGDWVEKDEPLAEIITDKINAELPSPVAGRLAKILVKTDETVPVGVDIALIEENANVSASPPAEAAPGPDASPVKSTEEVNKPQPGQPPTGQPSTAPQLIPQSQIASPPVTPQSATSVPAVQSPTIPQPVPPGQRRRRVIVTVVAALLIGLPASGILWQSGFPWYIVVALPILALILIMLIFLGYTPRWSKYTGFGEYKSPYSKDQDVQRAKTLWDWVQLLIIPFVIGAGAIWFNMQQSQISLQASVDQQRGTILQTYIDNIQDLLLNHYLLKSTPTDDVAILARARTLTALHGLDPDRKGRLLIFLHEAQLIGFQDNTNAIIDLRGADLINAALGDTDLSGANLSLTNLYGAALYRANLRYANLTGADLRQANLDYADLSSATITQQQLDGVYSCKNVMLPPGLKCP